MDARPDGREDSESGQPKEPLIERWRVAVVHVLGFDPTTPLVTVPLSTEERDQDTNQLRRVTLGIIERIEALEKEMAVASRLTRMQSLPSDVTPTPRRATDAH